MAVKPLPTSIKEKATHWPEELRDPPPGKKELVRIWSVTSRPMLQTKTLRATVFFMSVSVCVHNVSSRVTWAHTEAHPLLVIAH